jgi:hypothetical protein
MKLLTKLFGRKADATPVVECPTLDEAEVAELVRVYDSYGRELAITRHEWRDKVLLENLEAARQDPDHLYDMIVSALHDGFIADVLPYVEQLRRIDPTSARSATLLGVVYLQLHRPNDAERVLTEQVQQHGEDSYVLQRPDYQQALSYWDAEIAAARVRAGGTETQPVPTIAMLRVPCPLWLDQAAAKASLLPTKDENAVVVGFLGGSANKGETGAPRQQLADAAGRITRALSLFLGEQFHLRTDGVGFVLQPFVHGHGGGLVLAGKSWPADLAAEHARQGEPAADYVVVTHLDATAKTPTLSLRLIRTIDATVLESCETLIDLERPEPAFAELAQRTLDALRQRASVAAIDAPPLYRVPTGIDFGDYQLRLEQLLAATACELDGARPDFLNGEREMVLGTLDLCLRQPDNATTRFILVRLLERLQAIHPQVVHEFRAKVERLQREHPLPQPVQGLLDTRLAAMFS